MPFTGFPVLALDFYDALERDNSKEFWTLNKEVYDDAVRGPITALADELADEFGPALVFRAYRDVRFAKDKSPYKTHQGAFVEVAASTGWYVQVSAEGVLVAGGFHGSTPALLAAVRSAIDDAAQGAELEALVAGLERDEWELGGAALVTAPRGYARDHPRIRLLRQKELTMARSYGFEPVIHTAGLVDRVRADWQALRPLVEWLAARQA